MNKRKLIITILLACLACLLIFTGVAVFLHNWNTMEAVGESQLPTRETGTFADSLDSDLSSYVGKIVVGYAVDLDYLNQALNTVSTYSTETTAVYIFYAGTDRDEKYYVSITVYDNTTGEFADLDLDMVDDTRPSKLTYVYESRANLINTRK